MNILKQYYRATVPCIEPWHSVCYGHQTRYTGGEQRTNKGKEHNLVNMDAKNTGFEILWKLSL